MKPGVVTDPKRISSPPPPSDISRRIEDVPLPTATEIQDVFDEMVSGASVSYRRLMAVIDRCTVCDQVMTLPNILTHPCFDPAKGMGPCPSKRPLLPENEDFTNCRFSYQEGARRHAGRIRD